MAVLSTSDRGETKYFKGRLGLCFFAVASLFWCGINTSAQTPPINEYQIKAVFLFHFAAFVDWPTNAFPTEDSPMVIGIIGDDPFGAYLDEVVRGEKVNDRALVVQRYRNMDEVKTCHILFISRSGAGRPAQIISQLRDRSILTVGETEDFTRQGGMIRFVVEKNKLRLKINTEAAKTANLTIRSKLLRLAETTAAQKD